MDVTVDTCSGPRVYAGLVSSYFEKVTENYERMDSERWATELYERVPEDVAWMRDLVVRDEANERGALGGFATPQRPEKGERSDEVRQENRIEIIE